MTKIKAAVFEDVKQLEVKEIDRPVIRPDEVLVKLKSLCSLYVGTKSLCRGQQSSFSIYRGSRGVRYHC